jgi:hypothetical protein
MALANHTPTTWNNLLSTTFHNYRKSLTDNIFNSRPLLNFYMSKGRVREVSGGISIVEPVIYAEGDFRAYGEWDRITVTPVNTATAAQFPWRQLAATIAISGLEEAQNNSKEMVVSLLEAKIMQAEETLKNRMNSMLFGTYAGSDAANGFTGLPTIVAPAATAVGGIVNEAWWASNVTPGPNAVDAAGLERILRNAYNGSSDAGNDCVDAIFTNAFGFGFYESTLTPQVRYTDVEKANLGFQNLMFKNVPIFWDFECSGGTEGTKATNSASFYGLNSKYVGLALHSDRNFKQSPFTANLSGSVGSNATDHAAPGVGAATASALDARVSFITTFGNQTVRNRRRLFKVLGVTEA